MAFLCTIVAEPDEYDWKKLKLLLQYLRGEIDIVLTLGADNITKMKSWVGVLYTIHSEFKSHTGGAIYWGWCVLLSKCQKKS